MLGTKKKASQESVPKALVDKCPICDRISTYMYYMENSESKKKSQWYHCLCGVVWQADFQKKPLKNYNKDYQEGYLMNGQKHIVASQYPVRVYAPILEEMMYGRKLLEVGFNTHFTMQAFQERGWITFGIEVNDITEPSERIFKGDFETFQFPKDLKFNVIWMTHVLEHFKNPVAVLKKAYELLPEDGVIYIATPDSDFIYTRSSAGFNHWSEDEHFIMWNRRSLVEQLEKIGFDVVLSRRNYEQRFTSWDDLHIIAQKKFF